jgi:hypothetical protein
MLNRVEGEALAAALVERIGVGAVEVEVVVVDVAAAARATAPVLGAFASAFPDVLTTVRFVGVSIRQPPQPQLPPWKLCPSIRTKAPADVDASNSVRGSSGSTRVNVRDDGQTDDDDAVFPVA